MPTQPNVKDIETQLLDKLNKDQIIEKRLTNEDVIENIDTKEKIQGETRK
ncbi:hypothetical protein [Peribacillus butanolivorans]